VERRCRQKPAAPSQLQLHVVQERQALVARRSAAKLVAKRSATLKARQLQEDNLRADKEDELRLELELRVGVGLELQRAELEQQVQTEEARRQLSNLQQKADQGRACARSSSRRASCATRSLRVRCTAAPVPAPAPVGLPSTAHCPASGVRMYKYNDWHPAIC